MTLGTQIAPSGSPAAPPAHFAFSTRDVPPAGKFETWRDLWMRRLVEVDVSTPSPDAFEGDVEFWGAGPLQVAGVMVKKTIYDRTPTLARNGNNDFSFTLCGHDVRITSERTGVSHVRQGGGFFLSHHRPFSVEPGDDCYTCLLRLDRSQLLALMPPGFELETATFDPGNAIVDLIRTYVPLITSKTAPLPLDTRDVMGGHVIDLVALLLRPSRDALHMISGRGLKAARTEAVLRLIDRHFAEPGLTIEAIGRELGVSARQIHRLLEETAKTFYEHVLERRLVRARELLADPTFGGVKVADIAARAGFTDMTYFSRVFRIRFGDTPTGARASATRARTLRTLHDTLGRSPLRP